MRRLVPIALVAAMEIPNAAVLRGEDLPSLPRGATVRITTATAPSPLTGRILSSDGGSIEIFGGDGTTSVRGSDVIRLQLAAGRKDYTVKGAVLGGLIGFGAGVFYLTTDRSCDREHHCEWDVLLPLVLAPMGAFGGGGVGSLIRPERWIDVPVGRVRLGLGTTRGHPAATAGVAFTWP